MKARILLEQTNIFRPWISTIKEILVVTCRSSVLGMEQISDYFYWIPKEFGQKIYFENRIRIFSDSAQLGSSLSGRVKQRDSYSNLTRVFVQWQTR